jgi:hypothetical protein
MITTYELSCPLQSRILAAPFSIVMHLMMVPSSYTSPREIKNLKKLMRSGRAPGCDGVPNILLKNIPRKAAVFLTYIFNSCLKPKGRSREK